MRRVIISLGLVIIILSGCKPPPTPVQKPAPAPKAEVQETVVITAESWKKFVADTRSECEKNPGCTLDYDKLHEYDGRFFGVTVIGYKESEYYLDLFRFDPKSDKWIGSPRTTMGEISQESIDVPATSKEWSVPEATIRQWLDEADRTVKEIYSKRQ